MIKMLYAGRKAIVSILAVLTLILGTGAFAFAQTNVGLTPTPREVLYNATVSDDGNFVSNDFATPSTSSNDINVYFKNAGDSKVTVSLEKKGFFGWSDVSISGSKSTSFSVASGSEDYSTFDGDSDATYRVNIASPSGDYIVGTLRVRQQ